MINRRKFSKAISGFMAAMPFLNIDHLDKIIRPASAPLTIDQILAISWNGILDNLRDGQPFVDSRLNQMVKSGQIEVSGLGASIEWYQGDGVFLKGEVKQLSVPGVWCTADNDKNPSEKQRIDFATGLARNLINSHDALLLLNIGDRRAVVSRECRYYKSETARTQMTDLKGNYLDDCHYVMVITAYGIEPVGIK